MPIRIGPIVICSMSTICEHEFEQPDREKPWLSMTEFDLAARTGLSIRKNLNSGRFEIFEINSGRPIFAFNTLNDCVKKANDLEQDHLIQIKCGIGCPRRINP